MYMMQNYLMTCLRMLSDQSNKMTCVDTENLEHSWMKHFS